MANSSYWELFTLSLMAVIVKAMKAIMGMNLSTSIVEGSATNDLKGSLRDTGTTSYEFTSSFRSTCIFLVGLFLNSIKKAAYFLLTRLFVICM